VVFVCRGCGSMLGAISAGYAMDHWARNRPHQLFAGCLVLKSCAGLCLPLMDSVGKIGLVLLAWAFCSNAVNAIGGTLVCIRYGKKMGARYNAINAAFGTGALMAPMLAQQFTAVGWDPTYATWCIAIPDMVVGIGIGLTPFQMVHTDLAEPLIVEDQVRWRPVVYTLAFVFFVVAAELGLGSWIYCFYHQEIGFKSSVASLINEVYWLGFTVTRFVGTAAVMFVPPGALLLACTTFGLVASVSLLFVQSPPAVCLALGCIGFGISAGYGNAVSVLRQVSFISGFVQSLICIAASAGAMAGQVSVGVLLHHHTGVLEGRQLAVVATAFLIGAFAAMTLLLLLARRHEKREVLSCLHQWATSAETTVCRAAPPRGAEEEVTMGCGTPCFGNGPHGSS